MKTNHSLEILIRYIKYFLSITLLFFVSCKDNSVGPVNSDEIWPLKPGNVWFYKVEHPTWILDTLKMEITGTMTVTYQARIYTVTKMAFYGINESIPDYQWLYWSGPGGIYFMGGVSPTDTLVVKELELKYPAVVGDSWQYRSVAYSLSRKEFYLSDTLTYSLVGKDVPIETPEGNFKCYQFRYSQRPEDDVLDIWDYNFYYSPGLGLVTEEAISQFDRTIKDKYVLLTHRIW